MTPMNIDYNAADIKHLRERRRLTQEELAAWCGVEVNQVKRWEAGQVKRIRARYLKRIDELAALPELPKAYSPDQLRELRKRLRMPQSELAAAIGHEISTIKSWETGARVSSRDAGAIAQKDRALKALDALAEKAGMFR